MGFSRQEYWNGLPFPSPGDLPDPGIEPRSLALQADSLPTELRGKPLIRDYFIAKKMLAIIQGAEHTLISKQLAHSFAFARVHVC